VVQLHLVVSRSHFPSLARFSSPLTLVSTTGDVRFTTR
jgi:hypothetical protein